VIEQSIDARGVVTLTLNRPDAFNALSEAMLEALHAAIEQAGGRQATRVIIIAARGRAFCAGHDLKEMRANPAEDYYQRLFKRCSRVMMAIQATPVPVIAQVEGIATAAGCQLVAMCDLAVAARSARFAVSGVRLGLFCSTPSVALSRNIPRKQAFEMLVTGDFIDAAQAQTLGLINRVADDTNVADEVESLAASIVAKPAVAIRTGKSMFYAQLEKPLEEAYEYAAHMMACNMMSDDALEGVQAFIDKRQPKWAT
jgi:enoyl-CoA hydratase/carnithine racemase